MIYKGKRINAHIYGKGGEYSVYIPPSFTDGWGSLVHPFSANVTTEDLKNPWNFRFFAQKYPCTQLTTSITRYVPHNTSWNRLPAVWQELYTPILDQVLAGKTNIIVPVEDLIPVHLATETPA